MKVIVFPITALNNGSHFLFVTEIVNRAKETKIIVKVFGAALSELEKALAAEDAALKLSNKNPLTVKIEVAVSLRGRLYTALKRRIKSFEMEPSLSDFVTELLQAIKDYSIQGMGQRDKQGGLIINLITDLKTKYADAVRALALDALVKELEDANNEVIRLMEERTEDKKNQVNGALKNARKATDTAYRAFVDLIGARVLIEGDASYADYISYLNAEIQHYQRDVLHQKITLPTGDNNNNNNNGNSGDDGEEEPPQG
ncbi:MAG: DUF6261 family protein [Prevotellaceae bacterium]|jgi:hypothetical protein|nr:DUF6261 family protein [Prevotellaceae bacterium]